MSGSSGRPTTASCTNGNNGAPRAGLDINNTPNMIMAGPGTGMNMNGADASAAAGLNTTKANWNYTGPALPTAEAQQLLAQGANGPTDIHMAANGCASEPTFSQQINAVQYVQTTSQAVARSRHLVPPLRLDTCRCHRRTIRWCTTSTRRSSRRTQRP